MLEKSFNDALIRQNQSFLRQKPQMRRKFQGFKKNMASNYEDSENLVYEVLNSIQSLQQMRIVQKIARPINFKQKERYYSIFKQKFIHLHCLLQKSRKEKPKGNETKQNKQTHNFVKVGIRQKIKRDQIRKIQSAYTEAFIIGSFKYFYMISKLQGLPLDLQTINIEQWANECSEQQQEGSCC